jgi:signal transduction histidine kinase
MTHPPALSDLWIDVLSRVCSRTAHELKGALNGVSVNLEVVRSRADRPGNTASAVSTYATAASSQLDSVIALSDALLALGRPAREPVDIGLTVRHLATLLVPSARADGRRLEVDAAVSELGPTSANGLAVRTTIGACLLAAIDASEHVRCSATGESFHITSCDGAAVVAAPRVVALAGTAGIVVEGNLKTRSTISITFPR